MVISFQFMLMHRYDGNFTLSLVVYVIVFLVPLQTSSRVRVCFRLAIVKR